MAAPNDRVQLFKQESSAGGGDAADSDDFLQAPLEPNEDAPEVQGLFMQPPPPSAVKDENVYLTRNASNDLVLRDSNARSGAENTLSDLLNRIRDKLVENGTPSDQDVLKYIASSGEWEFKGIGEGPTLADVQQLAIEEFSFSIGTTYETIFNLIYGGSDDWGTFGEILVLTSQDNVGSGRAHDVRVFDSTNAQVIAEVTGISSLTPVVTNMGAIANLPAGEAVFDVQVRRTGGGFNLNFYTISLEGTP